jgi:ferredoxin
MVDRSAFDRIVEQGGYVTAPTGGARDANTILIPKSVADASMDAAQCIGCGACVAACPEGDVLGIVGGTATVINGLRCVGHGRCETACPVSAIQVGLVERLAGQIVQHATLNGDGGHSPGLAAVLAAAGLPPDTIAEVLRRYQARTGTAADFWDAFATADGTAESIGDAHAGTIETAVRLGALVGTEEPLLRQLHTLRQEGRWHTPEDLAAFSIEDWRELLEQVDRQERERAGEQDEQTDEQQDEAREWIEDRAEAIVETLEKAYPSAFLRQWAAISADVSPAARALLACVPQHDFHTDSIRERTRQPRGAPQHDRHRHADQHDRVAGGRSELGHRVDQDLDGLLNPPGRQRRGGWVGGDQIVGELCHEIRSCVFRSEHPGIVAA